MFNQKLDAKFVKQFDISSMEVGAVKNHMTVTEDSKSLGNLFQNSGSENVTDER